MREMVWGVVVCAKNAITKMRGCGGVKINETA